MATIFLNFEENLTRLDAKSLNDEELIKLLDELVAKVSDPDSIQATTEEFKKLAQSAIITDQGFIKVSRAFEKFIDEYGDKFPEIKQFFVRWQGYHQTWKRVLIESLDFATVISAEYRRYDQVYLTFVQNMETTEQMKEAIEALTQFSHNTNPVIPIGFAERLKDLEDEIKSFQDDFKRSWIGELPDIAKELLVKLKEAEDTVRECDKVIQDSLKYLGLIPIIVFFAKIIEALVPGTVEKRNKAQADVQRYIRELEEVIIGGLADILIKIAVLYSQLQITCSGLVIFATTWAFFHNEALEFANVLKACNDIKDIPKVFWSRVRLARAVAKPLGEGLDAYATVIIPSN